MLSDVASKFAVYGQFLTVHEATVKEMVVCVCYLRFV